MDLNSALINSLSLATATGELGACLLAARRRLWNRLPYFWGYLVLLVLVDALRWFILWRGGPASPAYGWTYWLTQGMLVIARGAALADVCRAALGHYTGVWRLARLLLFSAAFLIVVNACFRTGGTSAFSYVIFVERELEVAMMLAMLGLLLLGRYYGAPLNEPLRGIVRGLAFYSAVVVISNSILSGPLNARWEAYWRVFEIARLFAFAVAVGFWLRALWLPLGSVEGSELSSGESYDENTMAVSAGMRSLNDHLLGLIKR